MRSVFKGSCDLVTQVFMNFALKVKSRRLMFALSLVNWDVSEPIGIARDRYDPEVMIVATPRIIENFLPDIVNTFGFRIRKDELNAFREFYKRECRKDIASCYS